MPLELGVVPWHINTLVAYLIAQILNTRRRKVDDFYGQQGVIEAGMIGLGIC